MRLSVLDFRDGREKEGSNPSRMNVGSHYFLSFFQSLCKNRRFSFICNMKVENYESRRYPKEIQAMNDEDLQE